MFRFILWIGLGYLFFRLFRGRPATPDVGAHSRNGVSGTHAAKGKKMVKCLRCGLYVSENEALPGGWRNSDQFFCSQKCQQEKSSR